MTRTSLLAILPLLACSAQPPEPEELAVLAIYPTDGAASVPHDANLSVTFNKPLPRNLGLAVALETEAGVVELTCTPGFNSSELSCDVIGGLQADTHYAMSLDIGPDGQPELESQFTTAAPEGVAYDIGPDTTVTKAGANERAAELLDDLLFPGDAPLLMVLDDFVAGETPLPWPGQWMVGEGRIRPGDTDPPQAVIGESSGILLTAFGELDNRRYFYAAGDYATFPIETEDGSLGLAIFDIEMSGQLSEDFDSAAQIEIRGLVHSSSIESAMETAPGWAKALANATGVFEYDVDTDGDEIMDSISLHLTSTGYEVEIVEAAE